MDLIDEVRHTGRVRRRVITTDPPGVRTVVVTWLPGAFIGVFLGLSAGTQSLGPMLVTLAALLTWTGWAEVRAAGQPLVPSDGGSLFAYSVGVALLAVIPGAATVLAGCAAALWTLAAAVALRRSNGHGASTKSQYLGIALVGVSAATSGLGLSALTHNAPLLGLGVLGAGIVLAIAGIAAVGYRGGLGGLSGAACGVGVGGVWVGLAAVIAPQISVGVGSAVACAGVVLLGAGVTALHPWHPTSHPAEVSAT